MTEEPVEETAVPPARPQRTSSVRGGVLAAAMLGLREVLEGPKKEQIVIQAEAPGEPPDIDRRGLEAELDDGRMAVGPPLDDLKDKAQAVEMDLHQKLGDRGAAEPPSGPGPARRGPPPRRARAPATRP